SFASRGASVSFSQAFLSSAYVIVLLRLARDRPGTSRVSVSGTTVIRANDDPMERRLLFTIPSYAYLEPSFLQAGDFEHGEIERKNFPDGERYLRILAPLHGRHVVLLGGTPTDADWLDVFDLACGIARGGACSLAIVMPYFGYSTMERAVKPGEVVVAKARARLLSAIPAPEGGPH